MSVLCFFVFGVFALLAPTPVQPLKLPSYIKACSISDPKLNECAQKNGQAAIPKFLNGDKKYKIPNLNPLEVVQLTISQGTDQVGLQIQLKDAKLYGLKDTVIEKIEINLEKKEYTWYLNTPQVQILSDYNVTGKVLLLPIFGAGRANVTLKNPRYTYKWTYSLYEKNGEEYIKPNKGTIGYEVDQVYIDLKNLFNGDRLLGPQMNKFLNENWQDASREIGPSIAEALSRVIDSILKNICDTVPYKDVFKP